MRRDTEHLFAILQRPHLSEKTVSSRGERAMYAFCVSPFANKGDIKYAVEKIFGHEVFKVCTSNVKSKPKRFGGKAGSQKGWKKAYVTFKEHGQIDLDVMKV